MEQPCARDLWEEAKAQLKNDLGDGEWKTFTMQSEHGEAVKIQDIIQSLKATGNQARNKYGTHKVKTSGGKELFEYNIGRILTRLEMMFQMVDSTMSFAPQLASVVWTAFRMLFKGFLIQKDTCEFLSSAVDRISYAMFICEVCARRYLDKDSASDLAAGVVQRIPGVYAVVLRFSYETNKLATANHMNRFLDLMLGGLKELQSYIDTMVTKLGELERCVDIGFKEAVEDFIKEMGKDVRLVADLMPEMAQGIRRLEETSQLTLEAIKTMAANQERSKKEAERDKVQKDHDTTMKWLKPGGWLVDSSQLQNQHRNNLQSMYRGSCDWIFGHESYSLWLGQRNPRILWLFGKAGFGKSFISSAVIDAISPVDRQQNSESAPPIVIYFFCRSGNDASQKSNRIMLHLLMQLFDHSSPERLSKIPRGGLGPDELATLQRCMDAINTAKQRFENSDTSQLKERTARNMGVSGLQKVIGDLTQALGKNVFIVLDALDECSDWSDCDLLDALTDLTAGNSMIHLMITSRPEPSIVDAFHAKPGHIWCKLEVNKERTGPGIASYVDEELKLVKPLRESQRLEARDVIMEKSEGMFQWASAALETLKSPTSAAAFNKAIENLPQGMDNLYRKKLLSLDANHRDWSLVALRWLVCGEGSINAEPIADEIQRIYLQDDAKKNDGYPESEPGEHSSQKENEADQQENAGEMDGSLYSIIINALKEHAREFLTLGSGSTVAVTHASVREWIERDAHEIKTHLCQSCKDRQRRESTLEAAPKWGHLIMARNILVTLNNPEFQKKYGLLDGSNGDQQQQRLRKTEADRGCAQQNEVALGQESSTMAIDIPEASEDANDRAIEEKQDNATEALQTDSFETPIQPIAKDQGNKQDGTNVRVGENGEASVGREEDNIGEGQSTETRDFTSTDRKREDDGSSDLEAAIKCLIPSAVVASNEEGSIRDDATDVGADEHSEEQYANNSDPTEHLRYELTHWFYHVHRAEEAWPEEERQADPEAAALFSELYEQLDVFMQEESPPFMRWQKLLWGDVIAMIEDDVDKDFLIEGPVHVAARFNLLGMLQRYVATGTADLRRENHFGSTPLHIASLGYRGYVGSHTALDILLEQPDPPINLQSHRFGSTPLLMAIQCGAPESYIRALLAAGARPELHDKEGYTTLHWAALRGSVELCRLLLDNHSDVVDVNARDSDNDTPLHWLLFLYNSSYEVAEYLLDHGADVRAENNHSQQPLFTACGTSNTSIARLLIARGADVDDPETKSGWRALHAAVAEQNVDIVKFLIEEGGAEILLRDQKLRTPISLAAELGNEVILEFLLKSQKEHFVAKMASTKAGSVVEGEKEGNSEKEKKEATENIQVGEPKDMKETETLKETKEGVDGSRRSGMEFLVEPDINGQTPLHRAAAKGLESCVRLLLEYSGNPKLLCNQRNRRGHTPLHSAAHRGHASVVKMLADIAVAPAIDMLDNEGKTPLAHAIEGWKACFDSGNTNWSDMIAALWQRSPLLPQGERLELFGRAIEKGAEDVCRLLLDLVHVEDENGCTPLLLAVQEGRQNIIDLLSKGSPSRWSGVDKISCLDVSGDGLELFSAAATLASKEDADVSLRLQSVRTDCPIAAGRDQYYYEVTILECGDGKQN
ncbi:Ankyrin-1 [Lasiodiplodia theobromae]|uniref:Ankyrin-1 n=1 Tax=Lasiodiplodia theobromae TaxID=45133 RepID=A0A5N5CZ24_9PEZI|nr:Ankyrin-1 [Lasiodiplodia theobromae]